MPSLAEQWDSTPTKANKSFTEFPQSRGVSDTHKGIDYAIPLNTPITAATSGIVKYKTNDPKGYGNAIEIVDDKGNVLQRYAHLNQFSAPEGSRIEPGQVLGLSGSTGRSTGPHLHFEDFTSKQVKQNMPAKQNVSTKQTTESFADLWDKAPTTPEKNAQDIEQEKPKSFMQEMVAPISNMTMEEYKNLYNKSLTKAASEIINPFGNKQQAVENIYDVGKGIVKGVSQFAESPIQSLESAYKAVTEHPGKVVGEVLKGAVVDPITMMPLGKLGGAAKTLGVGEKTIPTSTLKGVGAAEVGAETSRIAKARELPIPIELSKDQATRNAADVRFARETAKDPLLGQPLQEKYASDNAKIQQNLNKFIADTGAEFSEAGTPKLGEMLVNTLEPYKNARKAQIEPAYTRAREAGHMSEPVDTNLLSEFVEKNISAAKNAPVISALENELKRLSKNGTMPINDLEEIRKMASVLAQDSGPNSYYGTKAIKIIDKMTENKGGELYKEARKINTEYMKEFENTPVVKNIFAMKRGTTQRATAIEDLVEKSLLRGPKDDVVKLFTSLEKAGPEGQVMINELRGYIAQKIKDEATKGVTLDINGKPYVSTKNLDTIIKNLDKSEKLEYIFGKKGAEQYRTLNEVTKDLQTVPTGTTNPSGTASTLLGALTEMGIQGATTGIPVPIAMIGKELYKKRQTKKKLNKISEFVNYGKEK